MKTHFIGIFLVGFTFVATTTKAQSPDNPAQNSTGQQQDEKMHHPGNRGNAANFHRSHLIMRMNLNLTEAQKQQAKALNEDYKNKVRLLEKDDNITLKNYRAQKAKLEQERKSKFQDLLTAEQKDKIAQAKKERNDRMQLMAQKRLDKMKTELSLTDDQVAKIQEQRKSSMDQMQAIRENSSLSSDEKREQMMDLRKRSHESLHSILTSDQLKKMEEMRNKRINNWKNAKTDKPS